MWETVRLNNVLTVVFRSSVMEVKGKIDGLWFANVLVLSQEKVNNNNSLQTRQDLHEESIASDLSQ